MTYCEREREWGFPTGLEEWDILFNVFEKKSEDGFCCGLLLVLFSYGIEMRFDLLFSRVDFEFE